MSSAKKDRSFQPLGGKEFLDGQSVDRTRFAMIIADALHREFGGTHAAIKIVVGLTGATERAVKNWFEAKNGPTGQHLVDLMRTSDEVLQVVLIMSGHQELMVAKKLADAKHTLLKMLKLIVELQHVGQR